MPSVNVFTSGKFNSIKLCSIKIEFIYSFICRNEN